MNALADAFARGNAGADKAREVLAEIEAEKAKIREDAQKNGSFLKAPNGAPSHLNEEQWTLVRTKRFKRWFGDWEKAARIEKLIQAKAVELEGYSGQYELNRDSAREWALENLRGEYVIDDTAERISLTSVGAKKVTSHGVESEAHLKSVADIPAMLKNATFITEETANRDGAKFDSYRYYVVGIKIDGIDYTARIVVGVKNGKRYYDHSLTQIEKGALVNLASKTQDDKGAQVGFKAKSSRSADLSSAEVKDTRLLSILQADSSKVVDENGEPLVVYHGTNAEQKFYEFSHKFSMRNGASLGRGFYFTEDESYARGYGDNVMSVFLNIRNPLEPAKNKISKEDLKRVIRSLDPNGDTVADYASSTKGYPGKEWYERSLDEAVNAILSTSHNYVETSDSDILGELFSVWGGESALRAVADVLGYDGFIPKRTLSDDVKIAFFPEQIKGATQNVGTYSRENPDIRFSLAMEESADADGFAEVELNGVRYSIPVPGKGFHVSAADFEKFDSAFMGTGEGAQAYGWGTYFLTRPSVWSAYRDQFTKPQLHIFKPWRAEYEELKKKLKEAKKEAEGAKQKLDEVLKTRYSEKENTVSLANSLIGVISKFKDSEGKDGRDARQIVWDLDTAQSLIGGGLPAKSALNDVKKAMERLREASFAEDAEVKDAVEKFETSLHRLSETDEKQTKVFSDKRSAESAMQVMELEVSRFEEEYGTRIPVTPYTYRAEFDETEENMLDWTKELTEERFGRFIAALRKRSPETSKEFENFKGLISELHERAARLGGTAPRDISLALDDAGFIGHKMPVGGTRTDDYRHGHNYVIYNADERVRITGKVRWSLAMENSFNALSSLAAGEAFGVLHNAKYGEIRYPLGKLGKGGFGFLHIVEQRIRKDGATLDDAIETAIRVGVSAEIGVESASKMNTRWLDFGGVRAIIALTEGGNPIITGYKIGADEPPAAYPASGGSPSPRSARAEEIVAALRRKLSQIRGEVNPETRFSLAMEEDPFEALDEDVREAARKLTNHEQLKQLWEDAFGWWANKVLDAAGIARDSEEGVKIREFYSWETAYAQILKEYRDGDAINAANERMRK